MILLVLAAGVGAVTGAFSKAAHAGLTAAGLLSDGGQSTPSPGSLAHQASAGTATPSAGQRTLGARPPSTASSTPPAGPGLPDVLAPAQAGAPPDRSRLEKAIDGIERSDADGSYTGSVIDAGTGRVLYAKNATKGYIPASTLKLLTTNAALSILGPEHRFATRVVVGHPGQVILVGGGDPYLMATATSAHPEAATLARLAQLTAARLLKGGHHQVALGFDASLFSGPAWNPDWPATYRDQVTPVSALSISRGGRYRPGDPRVRDPAEAAAHAFADALKRDGVVVVRVDPARASSRAQELASVSSLPLDRIVEHLLMVSDNDAAEVVSRQAAIGSGLPGSFAAATTVVRGRLAKLGIQDTSVRLRDGSGLSRQNRVPADLITKLLRLDLGRGHPELRAVVTSLPVAGVEGSLRLRFTEAADRPARGLVRGKTGTLTGVHALAGFVRRPDGAMLVYAFLVNNLENDFIASRWLERVSSALSTCTCH